MKTGLVLEGGAMRGLFSAGVLDVLLENNIEFDGAIGVSAGTCFGVNFKSKQIGRTIRYNKKYCKNPDYCSFRSLIKTGDIFGVDFCYDKLPNVLDKFDNETFTNNPMEFYSVSTDTVTGNPVYTKLTTGYSKDLKWIQASASMPIVSKVVDIDGGHYLDGGISDSIPLKKFRELGYDKCITVLTKPRDYTRGDSHSTFLIRLFHKDYPVLKEVMKNRPKMYNDQLSYIKEEEKKGSTLVIAPPKSLPLGRIEHNPEKMQAAYDIGRKVATEMLPEIKSFLGLDN